MKSDENIRENSKDKRRNNISIQIILFNKIKNNNIFMIFFYFKIFHI